MEIRPKAAPAPEAIVWDGTNTDEVVDLVKRVQALHVWSPLDIGALDFTVREKEPHLGLNITVETPSAPFDTVVARVEEGNVLVFDLFAKTPLFVMHPDEFAAFYEES